MEVYTNESASLSLGVWKYVYMSYKHNLIECRLLLVLFCTASVQLDNDWISNYRLYTVYSILVMYSL